MHGSQNNSLLFASLIWLLYVANCLTSAWLRWPRRWYHLFRGKARPLAFLVIAVVAVMVVAIVAAMVVAVVAAVVVAIVAAIVVAIMAGVSVIGI